MRKLKLNEKIIHLLEMQKVYVLPNLDKKVIYLSMGFKYEEHFDIFFNEAYQDEWDSVIRHLRLVYARELMLNSKILYKYLWMFCGFKSKKEMEDAIDLIAL